MSRLFVDILKKFFLITTIPLLLLFLLYFFNMRSFYFNNIEESISKDISTQKESIKSKLESIQKMAKLALYLKGQSSENGFSHLKGLFYQFDEFYEMVVYTDKGDILFGLNKYYVFQPENYNINESPEMFYKNGDYYMMQRVGLANSNLKLEYTISARNFFMKFALKMPEGYNFIVLNRKNELVFHNNLPLTKTEQTHVKNLVEQLEKNKKAGNEYTLYQENSVAKFFDLPDYPFKIGIEVDNSVIFRKFSSDIINFGILLLILIVAEIIATYVMTKRLIRPINKLNKMSENMESENSGLDILNIPKNELGDLMVNVQSAADRIKNLLQDKDVQHEEILSLYNENRTQLEKLDNLLNSVVDGVYVVNSEMKVTYINDSELSFLNMKREEVLGRNCYGILFGRETPCPFCPLVENNIRDKASINEITMAELGRSYDEREYVNIFFVPFGEDEYIVSIHDITEIKSAFNEIAEKESLLSNIFDSSEDMIFFKDLNGVYVKTNEAFDTIFGLMKDYAIGKRDYEIFDGSMAKEFINYDNEVIDAGSSVKKEESFISSRGTSVYLETFRTVVKGESGEKLGILGMGRDITERKNLERELSREKDKLLITLKSIGDGVIVTDYNQNVEMLNDVAVELTGYSEEEAKGRHIKDIFHIISEKTGEEIENPVDKCMETKSICQLENHTLLINKNEYPVVIADSAAPIIFDNLVIGAVLVFRDETEKRKMQAEMIKKQKLESVGVLAGGIAHDFNNILTAMSTYNSLLDMYTSEEEKEKKYIKNMSKLISRAEFLSNRLLTFAKGGAPVKQATEVYSIIKETIDFVLAGTEIDYKINQSEDLWKAEADPNQIAQVFHNILINARHAIDLEGLIKVNLENRVIEKDTAVLQKGKYVLISIADNGKGISKEHLERIFEPFYTSKSDGSGLGLSIVYSVVKNHDGYIYVESEEGKETTFYIYLQASG